MRVDLGGFLVHSETMFKWLKKHFIPHEGNNHRPHFLHGRNARRMILSILVLELLFLLVPMLNFSNVINKLNLSAVVTSVLTTLTNEERQSLQLSALEINPLLAEAARLKAEDMATKSYFAHTSPEGLTPWYWLGEVGYAYNYAGENLAINFTDSQDVTQAWMNSPSHRANIVMAGYTQIGTGVATGIYEGRETIFVAQFYGNPKVPVVANVAPVVPSEITPPPSTSNVEISEISEEPASPEPAQTSVLGTETATEPNLIEKLAVSPRHAANITLLIIAAFIILALLLNIFVKVNIQHPDLITNGLAVLVIVFGVYVINNYIASDQVLLTSFTAFDGEETSLSF